jgi:hypothetical protein
MPPTEAIAGRPAEAHQCFNIAVGLTVETRIAAAIVIIEKKAVGITVATAAFAGEVEPARSAIARQPFSYCTWFRNNPHPKYLSFH